ncbi:MAG: hypothetical protein JWQ09_53 [Segetibacter sp.]|nr:hypothetical protein [Segetibacter sp.]
MTEYNKNIIDKDLEKLIDQDKAQLTQTYEQNFQTQEQTLSIIVSSLRHTKFNNFKDNEIIWNISGYVNIISYDIKIITRDLTFARSEWQKRHYARQACLIIYESMDDIFKLLGKEFNNLTKNRLDITELQVELKEIRQNLNTFKLGYSEKLYEIRNVSIAHRDNEVLKQIELIQQISWYDTIEMIMQYDVILNRLGAFLTKLIGKGLADLSELKPIDEKS